MTRTLYLYGASALALTLATGGAACAATATAAAAPESTVAEVVVTGSHISGTPKDTAIPVQVLTQVELQKQGSPTVLDLIKTLPIVGSVLGDSNQFSTAAQGKAGAGSINLRGLGSQRTLVLLNGRRFQGASIYGADTNLLPGAAIGRVEILKDGAAATYGSDAIGGVVGASRAAVDAGSKSPPTIGRSTGRTATPPAASCGAGPTTTRMCWSASATRTVPS